MIGVFAALVGAAWAVSIASEAVLVALKCFPLAIRVDIGLDVSYTHCVGVVDGWLAIPLQRASAQIGSGNSQTVIVCEGI